MRRTTRGLILAVSVLLCGMAPPDDVPVAGSKTTFPAKTSVEIEGEDVVLVCTGAALRQMYWVSIYAIASYVKEGETIEDAEALAAADVPKHLQLTLERAVSGAQMIAGLERTIVRHHPGVFDAETKALRDYFAKKALVAGGHIRFTHLPGEGLRASADDDEPVVIASVPFAKALWEIWLGEKPIAEKMKTDLVSRL